VRVAEGDFLLRDPGEREDRFFIPVLNLFRPAQIAQEMVFPANPDVPPGTELHRPERGGGEQGDIRRYWTIAMR
jgi:hypothetical protein